MNTIVQWATILSPIIAVVIAWWMSKSSTRAANKQIAAMKELEKMQIKLLQLQLDKELLEVHVKYSQIGKREQMAHEYNQSFNQIGGFADSMRHIEERKQDLASEREYHANRVQCLQLVQNTLDELKNKL